MKYVHSLSFLFAILYSELCGGVNGFICLRGEDALLKTELGIRMDGWIVTRDRYRGQTPRSATMQTSLSCFTLQGKQKVPAQKALFVVKIALQG